MKVANRMESIPFSGIRKVFEEIIRREKAGENIIHLNIGRPDYDTPQHIKEAAKQAIDEGKIHYSSNYGIPELREALADKLRQDNNLFYDPADEIIVTVGVSEAVADAVGEAVAVPVDVGVPEGPSVGDGDAVAVTVLVPAAVGMAEGGGVCEGDLVVVGVRVSSGHSPSPTSSRCP